jgi:hypothetical protein
MPTGIDRRNAVNPLLPSLVLLTIALVAATPVPAPADTFSYAMGRSSYGQAGYSPGGSLYINAFPMETQITLDGVPIGVANDLQASLVDAHAGVHQLGFAAPGYEPTVVFVNVVRDWVTRVRLTLITAR